MGTTTTTVPPVTLTQRHLLGIEGMPVNEIEALLARSHFFASVIDASVVKGMFQQRIYRSLGLAAHLGWARLVIDRTKANIRYPNPGNSAGVADPAEDDAFENENITNADRAFASSYL